AIRLVWRVPDDYLKGPRGKELGKLIPLANHVNAGQITDIEFGRRPVRTALPHAATPPGRVEHDRLLGVVQADELAQNRGVGGSNTDSHGLRRHPPHSGCLTLSAG